MSSTLLISLHFLLCYRGNHDGAFRRLWVPLHAVTILLSRVYFCSFDVATGLWAFYVQYLRPKKYVESESRMDRSSY